MEERTDEWFEIRLGRATASRMADVLAKGKDNKPSASRENYAVELALELLTRQKAEGYSSSAMQRGTEMESEARSFYELITGNWVQECGFFEHPTIPDSGASPDGLVGEDGLIEIKCPESKQHLTNLVSGKPQTKYFLQMQWQMACTGRKWCDFVSYDPRFPEHLQIKIVHVPRDDVKIAEMEKEVLAFREEVDSIVRKLKSL